MDQKITRVGELGILDCIFFRLDLLKSSFLPDINPWKFVLPKRSRPQVLKGNHDGVQAGHLGSEKTYAEMSECYYWPELYSEVIGYVKNCKTFQRTKTNNQAKIANKAGKLFNQYEGPYIIKKKISPTIYELENPKGKSVDEYNINDLKLEIVNRNR